MRPAIFYDVEASGLYGGSHPIEVGWAIVDDQGRITSEAHLIRPEPGWTGWSNESEAVHGISRQMLADTGRPATEVVARMESVLTSRTVLSDSPRADEAWTDKLYAAAGVPARIEVCDADIVLNGAAVTMDDYRWLAQHLEKPRPHRAEADARMLAEAYVELTRRRWGS